VFALFVNEGLQTHWGNIMSFGALLRNVTAGLFGTFVRQAGVVTEARRGVIIRQVLLTEPPLWASWLMLFLVCALCLLLLSRKVKAYEVVK
ncbi:MAG TPA: hypothetical protein VHP99_20580, partial [Pyrinomonadaceae bacterium]|nr:hypothetical protein [Pyrinomonadaceae bacterium]